MSEEVMIKLTPETALAMALCATEHTDVTTSEQVEAHWKRALDLYGLGAAEGYGKGFV